MVRTEGLLSFFRKAFAYVVRPLVVPYAIHELRRRLEETNQLEDIIELAFSFKVDGVRIALLQQREEIRRLLEIVSKVSPKAILEIGTAHGGTLFLFSRVSHPCAKIISVDLPEGEFGGYPKYKTPFYKSFAKDKQEIILLRASSHEDKTLEEVKNYLKDGKLDLLFIDADHTYPGVKRDFQMYKELVNSGGMIVLHDICHHPPETKCEVDKFWNEVKDEYDHEELVEDWNQGWGGIGILYTQGNRNNASDPPQHVTATASSLKRSGLASTICLGISPSETCR